MGQGPGHRGIGKLGQVYDMQNLLPLFDRYLSSEATQYAVCLYKVTRTVRARGGFERATRARACAAVEGARMRPSNRGRGRAHPHARCCGLRARVGPSRGGVTMIISRPPAAFLRGVWPR